MTSKLELCSGAGEDCEQQGIHRYQSSFEGRLRYPVLWLYKESRAVGSGTLSSPKGPST